VASVDHVALGYDPGDVVRFSYAGGVVPSTQRSPELEGLETTTYTAADSQVDLRLAADRLERLLLEIRRSAPGVPVDVVGHSQGGVVARLAVTDLADAGTLPSEVSTLVTLGSPHGGADLATLVTAVEVTPGGPGVLGEIRTGLGIDLDPRLPSTGQLAETSEFVASLRERPAPAGVRAVSVAARTDVVVPVPRTRFPGAASVVVPGEGTRAHDALPGSPAATRELALAIGGRPPTCVDLGRALVDTATGDAVGLAEDLLTATVLLGGGGAP
jgi:pimeloyl-ACP methyl ester carboxylesterase